MSSIQVIYDFCVCCSLDLGSVVVLKSKTLREINDDMASEQMINGKKLIEKPCAVRAVFIQLASSFHEFIFPFILEKIEP